LKPTRYERALRKRRFATIAASGANKPLYDIPATRSVS
jgi:hypothetical protein